MKSWAIYFNHPVSYDRGVRIQQEIWAARAAGRIPDTILFLEHTPVVTLGRRGRTQHVVATREQMHARGVDFVVSSRGGDVTYHGPGQLVMYPILKLGTHEADAHGYLTNLEEMAIRTASQFGVAAFRRPGMSGAWSERGKIAAIGFQIKRWITLHGMSFNVRPDLSGFSLIVGCGLVGQPVSSLQHLLGSDAPEVPGVRDVMTQQFARICQRDLDIFQDDAPPLPLPP